jgi:hypothetical protein
MGSYLVRGVWFPSHFTAGGNRSYPECWVITDDPRYPGYTTPTCMEDVNVSNDLRQLSHGQAKALEYNRYNINRCHFQIVKLEACHPLAATTNSGVVTNGEEATGHVTDYVILQNIVEYTFGGAQELSVVFFLQCDWFDPINDTRVDDFGMVEVKHESRYSGINLLLTQQAH